MNNLFIIYDKVMPEDARRLIIYALLILVLLIIIVGAIGALVRHIMKEQGKQADGLVHDVVVTGVITSEKKLFWFGVKKNQRLFFKEAWIPFLIMLVTSLILLIFCITNNAWGKNPFGMDQFGTIFHHFDWDGAKGEFFGMWIVVRWPEVISEPHFSADAWGSYIFVPGILVGGIWFLVDVQAYIARDWKLYKLSKRVFNKTLDDYNPNDAPAQEANPENPENE